MSYQALARTWRPRSFDQLVGQQHVVRALRNAMAQGRVHHAMLFTGTRGVGKTTLGRIIAKCLNCEAQDDITAEPCGQCEACTGIDQGRFVDLIEIDAASRTKVDDTRELLDNVQYAPTRGRYKVYLIDEVHMLSKHSFNALLKTLEEPPPHVRFLLATTDPQKLPITILSRCLQFNLKRLPVAQIAEHLTAILDKEGVQAEPAAVTALAQAADGSVRDSLSLTDQAIAFCDEGLDLASVRDMLGAVGAADVLRVVDVVCQGDSTALASLLVDLDTLAPDFDGLLADMASALQRIALRQIGPEYQDSQGLDPEAVGRLAEQTTPEDVQLLYQMALSSRRDLPYAPDPRAGFEMALLRMLAFRPGRSGAASAGGSGTRGQQAQAAAPTAAEDPEPAPVSAASPAAASPLAAAAPAPKPPPMDPVRDWSGMIDRLQAGGLALQLARHSLCVAHEDDRLELQLDRGASDVNTAAARDKLQAALADALDAPALRLEVVVGDAQGQTRAAADEQAVVDRQRAAEQALENDDNVRMFIDRFGASIRPGSITPLDS